MCFALISFSFEPNSISALIAASTGESANEPAPAEDDEEDSGGAGSGSEMDGDVPEEEEITNLALQCSIQTAALLAEVQQEQEAGHSS